MGDMSGVHLPVRLGRSAASRFVGSFRMGLTDRITLCEKEVTFPLNLYHVDREFFTQFFLQIYSAADSPMSCGA